MEFIVTTIHDLWATIHGGNWPELGPWSYILLVLLVATEGPVSTLLGAAAAATGILDLRYVFVGAFVGNVLGDCLWYSVGSVNTLDRIYRYGRWIGVREHHLEKLERGMHAHAVKLIAVSKLAIGLIIPTLIAAGLARVPWRRWFPLVLAIETVWTIVVVNLGFHGAGFIAEMEQGIQIVGAVVLLFLLLAAFKFGSHFFKQENQEVPAAVTAPPTATTVAYEASTPVGIVSAANTAMRATIVLERTTKTIAAKSQAIKVSATVVAKSAGTAQVHFAGD